MTVLTQPDRETAVARPGVLRQAMSWHPPLMVLTAVMAAAAGLSGVGLIVDDRLLVGAPIWLKPFKFAISFAVYAATLAWMLSLVRRRRLRRTCWWTGTVIAGVALGEMGIITGQVLRGQRSHFNIATALDSMLYSLMGLGAVLVWVATLVVAVLLLRERIAEPASRWAIRLGLVLSAAGMAVGLLMTQPSPEQLSALADGTGTVVGAHSVGMPDGGPGMPLTGWSTTGGDLRVPHFVGIHALQAVPLLATVLGALAGRPRFARLRDPGTRLGLVWVGAATYGGVLTLLVWQALRGQPVIRPDATTLAALGVLALGSAAAAVAVVRAGRVRPSTYASADSATGTSGVRSRRPAA